MLRVLVTATLVLTAVDHWTTYVCLQAPVDGWIVTEANPIARWLFDRAGLGLGLLLDSAVTLGAVLFLATTTVFAPALRVGLLTAITLLTGFAVVNNFEAISQLGLAPWAGGAS